MSRPSRAENLEAIAARMRGMLHLNRGWITAPALAEQLGLPTNENGQATIRDAARHLNLAGVPVVSSDDGFRMATTSDEVRAYIESLESRTRAVFVRVAALKKIAGEMDGPAKQGVLFEMPARTGAEWDEE